MWRTSLQLNTDLLLPQNAKQEAEDVEAGADVDVVGLVGVDPLRPSQDLLEGAQLELAVGPEVGSQGRLEKGDTAAGQELAG